MHKYGIKSFYLCFTYLYVAITVEFSQSVYTVKENNSVQLNVTLSNPSSSDIAIQVYDIDGLFVGEKYIM